MRTTDDLDYDAERGAIAEGLARSESVVAERDRLREVNRAETYAVVSGRDIPRLTRAVTDEMGRGARLVGGLCFDPRDGVFYQAITRAAPQEEQHGND